MIGARLCLPQKTSAVLSAKSAKNYSAVTVNEDALFSVLYSELVKRKAIACLAPAGIVYVPSLACLVHNSGLALISEEDHA